MMGVGSEDGNVAILCADLDAFFVSAELVRRPELKGKPVVVGGAPEGRGVVAAASYEARGYGVRSAMPMSQAHRLCPGIVRLDTDGEYYRQVSRKVMAILREGAEEMERVSIDEAYLKVSDESRAVGVAEELRRRVRDELGLPMSVGIGPNKLLAKVASGKAKPDGVLQIGVGVEAAFLAPLSVEELPGVGPSSGRKLAGYGIRTVGELAEAPEEWLKAAFGVAHGTSLRMRAMGEGSTRLGGEGTAEVDQQGDDVC